MPKSILSQLSFTAKPTPTALSPALHRRGKLLERLHEQYELARCMLEGVTFPVTKERWITDAATGEKRKITLPKQVKPWFYNQQQNWFFEIRYGNQPIELAKGKTAILINTREKLLPTIKMAIDAADTGELDELLMAVKKSKKVAVSS